MNKLSWLGGFFDGEGSFSFSQGSPSLQIVNTDPIAITYCCSILLENNIEAKITERSKPSKSSKRKRWDIFINKADECFKFCNIMKNNIFGKKEQLELVLKYSKIRKCAKKYHEEMKKLNQSSNYLIIDKKVLSNKLKIKNVECQIFSEGSNDVIKFNDFNDVDYLCGIIDAEGTIAINSRKNKKCSTYRFNPVISFVNTNKEIISRCCSTLKNNNVGFHIQKRIPTNRNRIRWDVQISGLKRILKVGKLIKDNLIVKNRQLELLLNYSYCRSKNPKSVNDIGYSTKIAIEAMRK
ncbi:MAG: LAGLIDADG family homing endonuclease [Elusimicrobiota bacterium]